MTVTVKCALRKLSLRFGCNGDCINTIRNIGLLVVSNLKKISALLVIFRQISFPKI